MPHFVHAHATHPQGRFALGLVAAQLEAAAPRGWQPTIGWIYITDHLATQVPELLQAARERWPGVHWIGSVGVGVLASGVEYLDQPALALMLADLPTAEFRVFSGAEPLAQGGERHLAFEAATAQVHADPHTADLAELVAEMSDRTDTGYLFGGLTASRAASWQIANGAFEGGLSGVAFTRHIPIVSRVTQGCQAVGPARRITRSDRNLILELDGSPALDCLLQDIDATDRDPRSALAKLQGVLVGLTSEAPGVQRGPFGDQTVVRHLVGFDPAQRGIAIAEMVASGSWATFCNRDAEAARRDLVRICTEIRDELETESSALEVAIASAGGEVPGPQQARKLGVAGAVYVSCSGRGGPHFGGDSAELRIVQRALGDVPLVGFFAAGEIAHHRLFGYTGVLTVFPG